MGFADCPLRFDERLNLKEDYDIFLQVIHKYHKALRFNKYHYIVDHLNKSGGVVSYRTMDREKAQLELMQEKWGKKVIRFDIKKSVNPKIYVPLKGI
jgi:hypothetical protein